MTIGIIGSGNGGMAIFADLFKQGKSVKIYAEKGHSKKLDLIVNNGGFNFSSNDDQRIFVELTSENVAGTADELVEHSEIIYNTTPIHAHAAMFKRIWQPVVKRQKPVSLIATSGGFSTYVQALIQKENPVVRLASAEIFPYACRLDGLQCQLYMKKSGINMWFDCLNQASEQIISNGMGGVAIRPTEDLLGLALGSTNYIVHPTITIFNIAKVVRAEQFLFYREGITEEIANVLTKAEEERKILARALGIRNFKSTVQRLGDYYGDQFTTWLDIRERCKALSSISGPNTINTRYLWEDVPCGLVPMYTLGQIAGIDMPTIRLIIENANLLTGANFWNSEYNLLTNQELARLINP